jgi:hypothetical protein
MESETHKDALAAAGTTVAPCSSASLPALPHENDPNYLVMVRARTLLIELAEAKSTRHPERIKAAKAASDVSIMILDRFGPVLTGASMGGDDAAVAAGREAARRAVNAQSFGKVDPQMPMEWGTPPGEREAARRQSQEQEQEQAP